MSSARASTSKMTASAKPTPPGRFECARHATGMSKLWILRQQLFDAMQNVQGDVLPSSRVVNGDVRAQRNKIVEGFARPREIHAALGFRCSLRVSHEATHSLMRSC